MSLNQRLALKYVRTKFKLLSAISKRKAAEKAFILFCTPQYRNKKKLPGIFEKVEKLNFEFVEYNIQDYCWNRSAVKKFLILHARAAKSINASVIWLHDKDGHMTPLSDVQNIIERNYPNFEFHITKELGHRRIYRDNNVSKKVFGFLIKKFF
jgi:hypothetical protein